jgi:hypothetical protein
MIAVLLLLRFFTFPPIVGRPDASPANPRAGAGEMKCVCGAIALLSSSLLGEAAPLNLLGL